MKMIMIMNKWYDNDQKIFTCIDGIAEETVSRNFFAHLFVFYLILNRYNLFGILLAYHPPLLQQLGIESNKIYERKLMKLTNENYTWPRVKTNADLYGEVDFFGQFFNFFQET